MSNAMMLTDRDAVPKTMEIATTRASQEVQAAMVVAKRFPRDEIASMSRIMRSCKRKGLAEFALYEYPRGNTRVTGPSIRLAEALAQAWGNIQFGITELDQRHGESTVEAYAWDLETNARQSKVFHVKHERRVGRGDDFRIDRLTDPRDIYEMVANNGARRLRACILGVIPGDVVDAAVEECKRTLQGNNKEPLIDRVRKMVQAFEELAVSQAMIEGRLRHKVDATTEHELASLRRVFLSIKDGMAGVNDFFDQAAGSEPQTGTKTERLAGKIKKKSEPVADSNMQEDANNVDKESDTHSEPGPNPAIASLFEAWETMGGDEAGLNKALRQEKIIAGIDVFWNMKPAAAETMLRTGLLKKIYEKMHGQQDG